MKYSSTLLTLLLLTFVGCSTKSITPINNKRRYSKELNKTPEQLRRERAIEYYRLLRQNKALPKKRKRYTPAPTRRTVVKKPTPKVRRITENIEEQKMEIKQNLVYYCMRYRKASRFSKENSCNSYTMNIYENCRERYLMGEKGLLRCVKSQLK